MHGGHRNDVDRAGNWAWSFHDSSLHGGHVMYFVAAALLVLSGLFYAADHHEIGALGTEMCRYGSTFCDSPVYVFVGAIVAGLWATFVSMR
jgi:hypothetical protein